MAVGLFLLSGLEVDTSIAVADVYMVVLGLGLGFVMQVLVLAVQNAVELPRARRRHLRRDAVPLDGRRHRRADLRRHLREPARLRTWPRRSRSASAAGDSSFQGSPGRDRQAAAGDPPAVHHRVRRLAERRLRESPPIVARARVRADVVPARGAAAPDDRRRAHRRGVPRQPVRGAARRRLAHELEQKLGLLAGRENRHWVYEALAERAQADLTPQQLWLLFRLRDEGPAPPCPCSPSASATTASACGPRCATWSSAGSSTSAASSWARRA